MAKKVFFSFHYKPDNWRASQVRKIGALTANEPVSDNTWESIADRGDAAIKRWIGEQMRGRPCVVVLVGNRTAGRKWINYEIEKAWNDGRGVVGVHIHNLKNVLGNQVSKGANPFRGFSVGSTSLSSIVKCHDPPSSNSKQVYAHIEANIAGWVDNAIAIRQSYS